MIEVGQYLNDGTHELLVGAIKKYNDKDYAYLINEEAEEGFFVEYFKENDGVRFNKVKSIPLIKLLFIEFSDIEKLIKERRFDELSDFE